MSDKSEQPRIRAKVTNDVVDFPHTLLETAAWALHGKVKEVFEGERSREGVSLDMVALLTLTAFTLEGYVNALGWICLREDAETWAKYERLRTKAKVKWLARAYNLPIDWNQRPFSTLTEVIIARNTFAHPKAAPASNREQILEGTHNEFMKLLRSHKAEYEKWLEWPFVDRAYVDVEAAWNTLRDASGINPFDLVSGGSQGIEALERIEADGTITRL